MRCRYHPLVISLLNPPLLPGESELSQVGMGILLSYYFHMLSLNTIDTRQSCDSCREIFSRSGPSLPFPPLFTHEAELSRLWMESYFHILALRYHSETANLFYDSSLIAIDFLIHFLGACAPPFYGRSTPISLHQLLHIRLTAIAGVILTTSR